MELSVLIPSYQRPDKLRRCLHELLPQLDSSDHEILIGVDGGQDPKLPGAIQGQVKLNLYHKVGYIAVRQALMEQARGRVVLWLNDDSIATPDLLRAHLDSHQHHEPRIVVGRSSWKPVEDPTLFDLVVQETDLVFFRQAQGAHKTELGFRDCYGLNMSFPRLLAERVGGVPEMPDVYGYDDIELAYRMIKGGARAVFEPSAEVIHDHRYDPRSVHRREYLLGRAAYAYAKVNPRFAEELFGVDLQHPETAVHFKIAIRLCWRDAIRIEHRFLSLDAISPDSVRPELLQMIPEHWVLLKRLLWRWGVLDASRGMGPRWSLLRETSPESVLKPIANPV